MSVRAGRLYLGRPEPRESGVLGACLDLCEMHAAVAMVWRQNVGAGRFIYPDGSTSQFLRFGFPGLSDICGFLRDGRAMYIETKRPSKPELREAQGQFLERAAKAGCFAVRVRSVDELLPLLDAELERMRKAGTIQAGPTLTRARPPEVRKPVKRARAEDRSRNAALDLGAPF